jgi:hypothetical protein
MHRAAKNILALALALQLSACASVTITESQLSDIASSIPTWEQSFNFYLWGLIGEHSVNVEAICRDKRAIRMQSRFSGSDLLYGVLTAGIYLPRTARVWCERDGLL